ncbi:MAG: hypothetical protein EPN48_10220 [Microbacteriaceae bacterium]|nr:MAG: hypothetical protein EPN48_10220 [Microbacteriaceae bacterium]
MTLIPTVVAAASTPAQSKNSTDTSPAASGFAALIAGIAATAGTAATTQPDAQAAKHKAPSGAAESAAEAEPGAGGAAVDPKVVVAVVTPLMIASMGTPTAPSARADEGSTTSSGDLSAVAGVLTGSAHQATARPIAVQSHAVQSHAVQSHAIQSVAVQSAVAHAVAAPTASTSPVHGRESGGSVAVRADPAPASSIIGIGAGTGSAAFADHLSAPSGDAAAAAAQTRVPVQGRSLTGPEVGGQSAPALLVRSIAVKGASAGDVDGVAASPVPTMSGGIAPTATSTAPAPTPVLAPAPPTVATQLLQPVFTLARAGNGTHTVTVNVIPDNLGPVTVRAHVDGSAMHIELFSASDGGRDALKQLMPDLRRDLVSAGITANLDLSSQGQPNTHAGPSWQGRTVTPEQARALAKDDTVPTPQPALPLSILGSVSTLDVLV